MKNIIFAGGTGKRFWPASRKNSPKQFQNIVGSKPLIKLKYDYLRLGFKPEDIFVSTGIQYKKEVEEILKELPQSHFIYEPEMRDTGPAVALAVAYVKKHFPNEVVSTQWADHYIKHPKIFIESLKEAEKIVKSENKTIIIGVKPTFPSPHRGHIKFGKKIKNLNGSDKNVLCEFIRFVEKPALEVARQYIRAGDYSWNTGYFISTPDLILDKYKKFARTTYGIIKKIYDSDFSAKSLAEFGKANKISFDYAFAENLNPSEAYTINSGMGWYDVGEWISLKEALQHSDSDVVTHGEVIDSNSENCLVYNYEPKKLVATIQLKDMIVVNTRDVIAVFHKDDNPKLKEFLKKLEKKGKSQYL
ncbi:hypothetical protein A2982_02550 [candidate division WWE3 bacterium RIFCSPLOWO2_01_FULL_39_13]|uniref:Uncharacterized protein n=1 Tax=candidate division WWE3 bacterium RIFCSPLOWO2_01_FULL_39_13 TaxID=1802624 RepID=A0A1F4V495_UNCKA|nr:MAG: hypothetical protein A2982_02550 [candidate division WWE3 bacterium RIFCSPLOWO2_01_FULL_39_13]